MRESNLSDLTEKVLRYQETGEGLQTLIRDIALIVYSFPRRAYRWDEDDSSDFFCGFFPKIPAMIRRFSYRGRPFEAYLTTTLRWQLKTHAAKKIAANRQEQLAARYNISWNGLQPSSDPWVLAEESARYSPEVAKILKVQADGRTRDASAAKRVLFLLMKEVNSVDDWTVNRVSSLTGFDNTWLTGCIAELRGRMAVRVGHYYRLTGRRNQLHLQVGCLHERMATELDLPARLKLAAEIRRMHSRLARTRAELARIHMSPSHKDISEVIGVPKGSVDSGLFYLKNSFSRLSEN